MSNHKFSDVLKALAVTDARGQDVFPDELMLFVLLLGSLVCVVGSVGNILLLVRLIRQPPLSPWWSMAPVRHFLTNLAVAGLLSSVGILLQSVVISLSRMGPVSTYVCHLPNGLLVICEHTNIFLLQFFSVERYLAVTGRWHDRNWVSGTCTLCAWVLACLLTATESFFVSSVSTTYICHQHINRTNDENWSYTSEHTTFVVEWARKAQYFLLPVMLQAFLVELLMGTCVFMRGRRYLTSSSFVGGCGSTSYFLTAKTSCIKRTELNVGGACTTFQGNVSHAAEEAQLDYRLATYLFVFCLVDAVLFLPVIIQAVVSSSKLMAVSVIFPDIMPALLPVYVLVCKKCMEK